jgi:hypothetical protein
MAITEHVKAIYEHGLFPTEHLMPTTGRNGLKEPDMAITCNGHNRTCDGQNRARKNKIRTTSCHMTWP